MKTVCHLFGMLPVKLYSWKYIFTYQNFDSLCKMVQFKLKFPDWSFYLLIIYINVTQFEGID